MDLLTRDSIDTLIDIKSAYHGLDKVGIMLSIPCHVCHGKGHKEYHKVLDANTSLEDVKCNECDGKGYRIKKLEISSLFEIIYIMIQQDFELHSNLSDLIQNNPSIQSAIVSAISKNADQVINYLQSSIIENIMET